LAGEYERWPIQRWQRRAGVRPEKQCELHREPGFSAVEMADESEPDLVLGIRPLFPGGLLETVQPRTQPQFLDGMVGHKVLTRIENGNTSRRPYFPSAVDLGKN